MLRSALFMRPQEPRIATIDALRGLASFSVAWFHFTQANPALTSGVLKASGKYGWLGVDIFFVISGFVIPYSLARTNYSHRQFWRFLCKRMVRLDPPYFANISFILLLAFIVPLVPGFRGPHPCFTAVQLLSHIAYLTSVVGKQWVNPVFWSLGIEFQYYLLIGGIFPFVAASQSWVRVLTTAALLVPGFFLPQSSLLFVHLPLFVVGILTYQFKVGLLSRPSFFLGLAATATVMGIEQGSLIVATCTMTALVIAFIKFEHQILTWLGTISYSLYLMHVPIGGKVIDLGVRFRHSEFVAGVFLIAATASSLLAAWVLYKVVELPSQGFSSRIKYTRKQQLQPQEETACAAA